MDLSIVIPISNEEAILEKEIANMMRELRQFFSGLLFEVVLVENGSFDRTRAIVGNLQSLYPEIRGVHLPAAGYGAALKKGLLESRGAYVALFNIDFWDVSFIDKALGLLEERDIAMVVGSKTMRGAEDARPFLRRCITRSFNCLLRAVFGFRGTDTHGMKLLVRDRLLPVIAQCQTEREIFDTEFVLRAQRAGLKSREVPVVCAERRKTTYRISKRIPRTMKDLVILFFRLP